MESTPDDYQTANLIRESVSSLPDATKEDPLSTDAGSQELKFTVTSKVPSFRLSRLILGGIILIGIVATFFLLTTSEICFLSTCNDIQPAIQSTEASEFWAFTGGTATLVVLTTLMGVSLLPAVGISAVIWYLMHISL